MPLSDALLEQISVVLAQSDPDYRVVQRLAKTVREACEVEFDCRRAQKELLEFLRERLAKEETGEALYSLGLDYAKGRFVNRIIDLDNVIISRKIHYGQDPKKAAALFQQAADLEVPEAQCELGCCYANGFGVDQNYGRAIALFRQSIDNTDHPEAHYELGCCYMKGLGVEEDLKLAVEHLEAAVQGDVDAMDELEDCRHELREAARARRMAARVEAQWFDDMVDEFGHLLN